jgi:carbon starvation protein
VIGPSFLEEVHDVGWILLGNIVYEESGNQLLLRAMPLLLIVLLILAIAYRYYSAFLAARVAVLDDARPTPAHTFYDGQNYHPTNKWVLFGHHFAAISGAGPLIGPVLAIQYGYMPGLLWLLVGVCLAGAVQDFLVLTVSVRRGGKSLAEIARSELGKPAAIIVSAAILFIVIIALAGLGIVVVKALGGETIALGNGTQLQLAKDTQPELLQPGVYRIPAGAKLLYPGVSEEETVAWGEAFAVKLSPRSLPSPRKGLTVIPEDTVLVKDSNQETPVPKGTLLNLPEDSQPEPVIGNPGVYRIPAGGVLIPPGGKEEGAEVEKNPFTLKLIGPPKLPRAENDLVPLPDKTSLEVSGSSWGTFTIACTIPIALFVGLYMYKIRKGYVVEASLIGAVGVLLATFFGSYIPESPLRDYFSLNHDQTTWALMTYGFVASVLPVWMLLCPRDYLSSFLKIGTIALLVVGLLVANPTLKAPMLNPVFQTGGPTFKGNIFPFVFICIMCGAISGFHSLVSSGTTPKMVNKEKDTRMIGYGSMLMEGLVGVVALLAAASLDPVHQYFPINTPLPEQEKYQADLQELERKLGADPLHLAGVRDPHQLPVSKLNKLEENVGEALRGRTGGAVTLAVGMAVIFTDALRWTNLAVDNFVKYWYHFAIMFEALFILTTIDTGTRIARFLLQEALGKIHPQFEKTDWWPGATLATALVTLGWGLLVLTGSVSTIWPMFGIANQLLAVVALSLVTSWMINSGRARYAPLTILPMLFVMTTTLSAGALMLGQQFPVLIQKGQYWTGYLSMAFTLLVIALVGSLLLIAVSRWILVLAGRMPPREGDA